MALADLGGEESRNALAKLCDYTPSRWSIDIFAKPEEEPVNIAEAAQRAIERLKGRLDDGAGDGTPQPDAPEASDEPPAEESAA